MADVNGMYPRVGIAGRASKPGEGEGFTFSGKRRPKVKRICEWCGDEWLTSQPNARYHSDACRNAAWYAAQRETVSQNGTGDIFPTARAVGD